MKPSIQEVATKVARRFAPTRTDRAQYIWGTTPEARQEWITKSNGKWNGYPPAKWHNPAVMSDGKTITIYRVNAAPVTLPYPPAKIVNRLYPRHAILEALLTYKLDSRTLCDCAVRRGQWVVIHTTVLPEGYVFSKDKNGPKIVELSTGADLHLDFNAGLHDVPALLGKLQANKALRAKQAAEAKKTQEIYALAQKSGARVTLLDSLAGGNCCAGSVAFATRHGLRLDRAYTLTHVLRVATPGEEKRRARVACSVAALRHHRFTAAGAIVFYPNN